MDWDDITSAKGAGAKPGRVTLGAWIGLAVLVALHATLFVVGIVTWSSPCSYPLAPLLVAFGWLGAWTCSLFFRQWALFVKSGRAPTGMCACFHAAASISVGAALTVVTVIAWDSCWVTAPELSYCALGASLAFVLGTACGICVPMMRSVSVPAGFATAQAPVVAHRVGPPWQRWLAWLPLVCLLLTEMCIWVRRRRARPPAAPARRARPPLAPPRSPPPSAAQFVVTIVVLAPLVAPGFTLRPHAFRADSAPPSRLELLAGWLLLVLYQLFFAMSVLCVVCTVATPPGEIPSWLKSDGRSDLHSYSNLLQALERKKKDGSPRFCRKTSAYKPDRAHYCSEAGGCVLQYQHFSLTFNTAVGFYNYKYYLLAAFYGALTSGWALVASGPDAADILSGGLRSARAAAHFQNESLLATCSALAARYGKVLFSAVSEPEAGVEVRRPAAAAAAAAVLSRPSPLDSAPTPHACPAPRTRSQVVDVSILLTFALNALCFVACVLVLGGHIWLICIGRTAYEARQVRAGLRKNGESLFHYGAVNNFALTLGIYPLLWLVPTRTGIEGNGIFFPERGLGADRAW